MVGGWDRSAGVGNLEGDAQECIQLVRGEVGPAQQRQHARQLRRVGVLLQVVCNGGDRVHCRCWCLAAYTSMFN